jgi:hypothetical protein
MKRVTVAAIAWTLAVSIVIIRSKGVSMSIRRVLAQEDEEKSTIREPWFDMVPDDETGAPGARRKRLRARAKQEQDRDSELRVKVEWRGL